MYLVALVLLFFILLPVVIFFADGYRYRPGFGIVQTGGIFVSIPYSEATVSMNGLVIGTSSFLQRSFYIDNLTPGTYTIIVERENAIPWIRALFVEPQLVTDARVVLVSENVSIIRLTASPSVATSTRQTSSVQFAAIRSAFTDPAPTTTASSVVGESLIIQNGDVSQRRNEGGALPSSNFCTRPSYCYLEIPIERGEETTISADYFAGGVVYATREGGVYFSEPDVRVSPVSLRLYPKTGADFRIVDDLLVVKDGSNFYEISL